MKLPFDIRSINKRQAIRIAMPVLALGLIASVVTGREKPAEAPVQPAARIDARVSTKAAVEQDLDIASLVRKTDEVKAGPANDPAAAVDLFARRSFGQPQQQGEAAPAAPAAAPALPFRYLGKAIEDGKLSVFLMRGEDSFSVSGKQKLDDQYRIDKVSETAITFTYLPLQTKQTLDIPAAQ